MSYEYQIMLTEAKIDHIEAVVHPSLELRGEPGFVLLALPAISFCHFIFFHLK